MPVTRLNIRIKQQYLFTSGSVSKSSLHVNECDYAASPRAVTDMFT